MGVSFGRDILIAGYKPAVFRPAFRRVLFLAEGIGSSTKCLRVMKALHRGILHKTVAIVSVLVATGGWIWLLYILAKWLIVSLRSL